MNTRMHTPYVWYIPIVYDIQSESVLKSTVFTVPSFLDRQFQSYVEQFFICVLHSNQERGIPHKNCQTCHERPTKSIGVSLKVIAFLTIGWKV